MATKRKRHHVDLKDEYERCAKEAQTKSELHGVHELERALPRETNADMARSVGIWFWEQELKQMAFSCFLRSLAIRPEADTYFNLAVCLDDLREELQKDHDIFGHNKEMYANGAARAMQNFYELATEKEVEECEKLLWMNGKDHLVRGEVPE